MTPQELEKLTELLAKEETLVRQELEGVANHDPATKEGFITRPPDYGGETDEDDTARKTVDSETDNAMEHELKHRLDEILKAQDNLKIGRYGICESCGAQIPMNRLVAVPMTPYCINCAK
jgi:RNA polymerase-binding transcription factor DksA